MKTYSSAEMLAIWRTRLGLQTSRTDASVVIFEGIDTDAHISRRMRLWYLDLLRTADPSLLPTADVARQATLSAFSPATRLISLPDGALRPLLVKMQGWISPVVPLAGEPAARAIARLASPYAQPCTEAPLAACITATLLVGPVETPVIESLTAVVDPGPDRYVLDESLLNTIPTQLTN